MSRKWILSSNDGSAMAGVRKYRSFVDGSANGFKSTQSGRSGPTPWKHSFALTMIVLSRLKCDHVGVGYAPRHIAKAALTASDPLRDAPIVASAILGRANRR